MTEATEGGFSVRVGRVQDPAGESAVTGSVTRAQVDEALGAMIEDCMLGRQNISWNTAGSWKQLRYVARQDFMPTEQEEAEPPKHVLYYQGDGSTRRSAAGLCPNFAHLATATREVANAGDYWVRSAGGTLSGTTVGRHAMVGLALQRGDFVLFYRDTKTDSSVHTAFATGDGQGLYSLRDTQAPHPVVTSVQELFDLPGDGHPHGVRQDRHSPMAPQPLMTARQSPAAAKSSMIEILDQARLQIRPVKPRVLRLFRRAPGCSLVMVQISVS